jgi:hypothetical protein
LIFVYFEDEPGRRSAATLLTKDEARRIAANTPSRRSLLRRTILNRESIMRRRCALNLPTR